MIFVGIDVAKDKHDCFIISSEREVLADVFTISNSREGFDYLLQTINTCTGIGEKIKVGLEATGHYSYNLLGFLLDNDLPTYVINPLHTNLYRKSLTLRKTKTDRVDARTIASMLMSDVSLKPYTNIAYHNSELKSLTRYRFDKVSERAKLKTSVSRLVNILFPELENLLPTLHTASAYALLSELPSAKHIAEVHLTRLTNLLYTASKGRYNREKAVQIREAARNSIGTYMPAKALELKHTIKLIREFNSEITEIESEIQSIMDNIDSTITTIPGISFRMGAMIIAEIGDFNNFDSPDKILAFAGLSPSTYQSGKLNNCYSHMEKRGSRYLRYALFNATKFVCKWCPVFADYLAKKRSEGKHYYVAISHAAKKLVRLIFALQKSGQPYSAKA
ncbi:IS110 family transposase [Ruminococcus sp.]|uniref:IS110 family transposase n=1 Tax=Ruminococcus sp. TaxID=41978 RepID=UPI00386B2E21